GNVACNGTVDDAMQIRVATQETRVEFVVQAEHVVQHKDLPIHTTTSANADDGDLYTRRYFGRKMRRYLLQHQGEAARLFKQFGIFTQAFRLLFLAGTYHVGAEFVDALWRQSQVAHD